MKKFLLVSLFALSSLFVTPVVPVVQAQAVTWQCSWQNYCGYNYWGQYMCYQRQQCCTQWWNNYTGAYVWRCEWR